MGRSWEDLKGENVGTDNFGFWRGPLGRWHLNAAIQAQELTG